MAVEETWALQNAAINAVTFRQATGSLFAASGVPNAAAGELAVTQQSTANMSVKIAPGRAWMAGTQLTPPSGFSWTTQGSYFTLNDASVTATIASADPVNPRIDLVYIAAQDSFYSGASNTSLIGVVTGTPAPSPSAPSAPANATALALVAVAANVTSIVNANITDLRTVGVLAGTTAPTSVTFTPSGNQDTPTSGSATWFSFGNITVPAWATKARITWSVNGYFSGVAGVINTNARIQLGSVGGPNTRLPGTGTTNENTICYTDVLTGLTAGSQALSVVATFVAGGPQIFRLDANHRATASVDYLP